MPYLNLLREKPLIWFPIDELTALCVGNDHD